MSFILNYISRQLGNSSHKYNLLTNHPSFLIRTLTSNTRDNGAEESSRKESSGKFQSEVRKESNEEPLILHVVPRARTLPSPSPFVMKLWTYVKMANIPYKIDTKKSFGPKGRSPWISIDGQEIGDSQLIIKYLSKKYNKDFSSPYTREQLAISTATRIMLEEHYVWGMTIWRTTDGLETSRTQVFKLADSFMVQLYFRYYYIPKWTAATKAQGLGVHTKEEVIQFMFTDLRAVSAILGTKPFILGNTPCEDDCGVFGVLSQVVWGSPGSPSEKLVREELPNLRDYCERMKEAYWPDWNQQLARV